MPGDGLDGSPPDGRAQPGSVMAAMRAAEECAQCVFRRVGERPTVVAGMTVEEQARLVGLLGVDDCAVGQGDHS